LPSGPAWAALAGRFGQALEVWPGGHPELEQSAAMRLVQARLAQAPPTGEPDLR
jgi:alkanesulfonate monooxygenase SsuD/methylene tetrahydromethanopterin reductase-like flavin-dependent oxidoreductase (luciferase family)